MAQWLTNPARNHEVWGLIPASLSGLRTRHYHELCVGCRCSSNLALLWHRPAAVAPIQPLAWEPPYASGVALKSKK